MQQAKNQKVIETVSLTGQQVRVSLVQEKPYLFSTTYEVEIVGKGKAILEAQTIRLLVGPKEFSRIQLEVRTN